MKWNWGTGLFIVIVVFMIACFAFLYYSRTQVWSLVEEDYYPKELRHEEKLVKMRNANALATPVLIALAPTGVTVRFPDEFRSSTINGSILIYRPSDEKLDVHVPLSVDTSMVQLVPKEKLSGGRYVVKVEWTVSGKGYYTEKDIFVP